MSKAKVSEIFISYQGEGTYAGSRQLFVRFFGCNLNCGYCDTRQTSYKSFNRESLLSKILDFENDYNELAFTGGEPLLHADFLEEFIPAYRKIREQRVYLETNGVMFNEVEKIVDMIDVVAMDFKLPSSSPGQEKIWDEHRQFIERLINVEVIAKAVITGTTTIDDIKEMSNILKGVKSDISVVLQPVTDNGDGIELPDSEMLEIFRAYIKKETEYNVNILGQFHKALKIR